MATNVAFSGFDDRNGCLVSSALVAQYKRAHQEMLAAIEPMDELAFGPVPNQLRLSHTRLRLTRAANDSRAAVHKVLSILSELPSPTVAHKVQALKQMHVELKEAARRHMATWTHTASLADWRGYCRSHSEVAQRWRETIDRERQLIYPML